MKRRTFLKSILATLSACVTSKAMSGIFNNEVKYEAVFDAKTNPNKERYVRQKITFTSQDFTAELEYSADHAFGLNRCALVEKIDDEA